MKQIGKYEIKTDLFYEPVNHFWVDVKDNTAVVGMSPLIQEINGSFVAIQIDQSGNNIRKNYSMGSVEAEKHVGQLRAPLTGRILLVNENVLENPRLVNDDPYGEGWLLEMEIENPKELKDLLSGEERITQWVEGEIERFNKKGWIAQ